MIELYFKSVFSILFLAHTFILPVVLGLEFEITDGRSHTVVKVIDLFG